MRAFYETFVDDAGGVSRHATERRRIHHRARINLWHFTQRFIADYTAAKEAARGLALSAAQEWGPYNIRVNVLETALDTTEFRNCRAGREAAVDAATALIPMRRMGDPVRDAGAAAVFLASDDSRYLTGEIIHADGGEHLSAPVFEPRLLPERDYVERPSLIPPGAACARGRCWAGERRRGAGSGRGLR